MAKGKKEVQTEFVVDGEVIEPSHELFGRKIIRETRRPDGSLDVSEDYTYCPSMAEQHTGHLTDINWLIERFKPDELAQYMAAKYGHKREIRGHDFSQEPDLAAAMSERYRLHSAFSELPDKVRGQFKNVTEFLKFIDNPANADRMVELGLLKKKQIEDIIADPKGPVVPPKEDSKPSKEPAV